MRSFIAIDVPERVSDALVELQNALRVGKRVNPEQFHMTIVFLDDQPDYLIEEVHYLLKDLHFSKFDLTLRELGTFGGRAPNALYTAIEKNDALDLLQEKVSNALRAAGVQLDRKRFKPHVTIARFGRRLSKTDLDRLRDFMSNYGDFGPISFMVESYSLYRSTLNPKGANHEELARYDLT